MKCLPDCRVIVSRPTYLGDNDKAALMIGNLNKQLSNLEIECIENYNINDKYLGKEGLHSNKKEKGRLVLTFLNQIRKFWCSAEHLIKNPLSFEILQDADFKIFLLSGTPVYNPSSSDNHCVKRLEKCPYLELFRSKFSRIWNEYGKMRTRKTPNTDTFHAVNIDWLKQLRKENHLGHININSVRNKSDSLFYLVSANLGVFMI